MKSLLLCLAVVTAVALVACDDNGDEPGPSPTAAAATQTPIAGGSSTCPINPEACRLAVLLEGAMASRDLAAIAAMTATTNHSCPGGRPQGPGGPFPLCDGAAAGEQRTGVGVARRYSEGAAISVPDYQRFLGQLLDAVDGSASDQYGGGAMELVAVSCLDPQAPVQSCPRFTVIFSAIFRAAAIPPLGIVPGREVLVFFFEDGSQPSPRRITSTWTGIIQQGEGQPILQTGGTLFDLGRIFGLD